MASIDSEVPVTTNIIEGLQARRAEMVREIRGIEQRLQELLADIEHLDRAIVVFDPAHRVHAPSISSAGVGGHITRTLLGIMRKAPEPMTLRALTVTMMQCVGLDHRNPRRVVKCMEQARTALTRQIRNRTVEKLPGPDGRTLVWRVAMT
jgi:hypothetical protein